MKLPNGQYDISKIGLDKPQMEQRQKQTYNPFDYEAKYMELLKLLAEQQKEIEKLKQGQKVLMANFNKLAEAINGKTGT